MKAAERGNKACLEILLGLVQNHIQDYRGQDALMIAEKNNRRKLLPIIKQFVRKDRKALNLSI